MRERNTNKKPAPVPRKKIDWEAIRQEYEIGQLDLREIARQHGITHPAIILRAKRKCWGERAEKIPVVTELVTQMTHDGGLVTNPRIALTAFHRAINLLIRHRKMLGALNDEIERCFADLAAWRLRHAQGNQNLTLFEIEQTMRIIASASQALGKLVPLERRAFGFTDQDGPSEFDGLTPEQIEAVETTFRKALDIPQETK